MDKYTMNIFSDDGFVGTMLANTLRECEVLSKIELEIGNAVEVFETSNNRPVENYTGKILRTDSDGYFGNLQ